jgi:uncharacterized membrane protein YgaE (UPF0421/DUF939 family)
VADAAGTGPVDRVRESLRGLPGRALGRVRDARSRIVLGTATAVAAWAIAQPLLGRQAAIFAPIAALVCLIDSAGKRGRRAVRLLVGVVIGVVVGEATQVVVGSGWLQVAVVVAVVMLLVSLGSINPLTLLQSSIAALLVVGLSSQQTGVTRLASAVIGGVLALLVSQVLASPSPRRVLADAASSALRPVVTGLEEVAGALIEDGTDEVARGERARGAAETLRAGHEALSDFLDTRSTADALVSATLRGRRERERVRELQARFGGLEYVYAGAVLLARTTTEVVESDEPVPAHLRDAVADLAAVLRAVADDPSADDPTASDPRGTAGEGGPQGAHEIADALARTDPDAHDAGAARLATQMHLLAADVADLTEPASGRVSAVVS